jgi:hypothetical protein
VAALFANLDFNVSNHIKSTSAAGGGRRPAAVWPVEAVVGVRMEETSVRVWSSVVSIVLGHDSLLAISRALDQLARISRLFSPHRPPPPHQAGTDASTSLCSNPSPPSTEARAESIRPSALYPDLSSLGSQARDGGDGLTGAWVGNVDGEAGLVALLGQRLMLDVELEGLQVRLLLPTVCVCVCVCVTKFRACSGTLRIACERVPCSLSGRLGR